MLPAKLPGEDIRWIEKCAHNKGVYEECDECNRLTEQGQRLFEPAEPNPADPEGVMGI